MKYREITAPTVGLIDVVKAKLAGLPLRRYYAGAPWVQIRVNSVATGARYETKTLIADCPCEYALGGGMWLSSPH